ncbi:ribosomal-protein-alanine acetyltransferase [Kroppenstedtia guangzhouensis]|uniref:Ribosomal-protein-alanine acetyltransferase n=2 Tax=Kroppenstedtia guangzhouensis TaxID=1274356 RepID=A0ABQ1GRN4_9BACL|nr:ribosomal-protein-alanine acetyltransferase [Kroppenstedtia guangzhouensis]
MGPVPEERGTEMKEHPKVKFRQMTPADIAGVLVVERASFSTPWTRQAFFNELVHNQFSTYILAMTNDRIIGYGGMWLILKEAHITNIAVHPDWRGRGIGESMFDYLMALAHLSGAEKMTLEVRVSNEIAQNLYRKKGFKATGIRPRYYTDNQEDALIMWAELGGENDEKMLGAGN